MCKFKYQQGLRLDEFFVKFKISHACIGTRTIKLRVTKPT